MSRQWSFCGVAALAVLGVLAACATGESEADLVGGDPIAPGKDGGTVLGPGSDGGAKPGPDPNDDGGGSVDPNCTGRVVINEVQPNGSGGAEFVELYNAGGCAVDLAGWRLGYRKGTTGNPGTDLYGFQPGTTIDAGEFLLVANASFKGSGAIGRFPSNAGLGDTDGQVGLLDDKSTLVDAVGYGTSTKGEYTEGSPAAPPPSGASIGRGVDGDDTDDNATDFRTFGTPSPGVGN